MMPVCTVGLNQFRPVGAGTARYYWNVQVFVDTETQTKFGFIPYITVGRSAKQQPLILTEEMIEYAKEQAADVLRRMRDQIQRDLARG